MASVTKLEIKDNFLEQVHGHCKERTYHVAVGFCAKNAKEWGGGRRVAGICLLFLVFLGAHQSCLPLAKGKKNGFSTSFVF